MVKEDHDYEYVSGESEDEPIVPDKPKKRKRKRKRKRKVVKKKPKKKVKKKPVKKKKKPVKRKKKKAKAKPKDLWEGIPDTSEEEFDVNDLPDRDSVTRKAKENVTYEDDEDVVEVTGKKRKRDIGAEEYQPPMKKRKR